MGCRCRDKRNCTRDISKITKVQQLFSSAQATNISVSIDLNNLATKSLLTFFSINMNSLMNEERKLNDDMTDMLPNLITKCENKIEDLHNEYKSMSREDYDYHHRDDD